MWRSRSTCQKSDFQALYMVYFASCLEVKGHKSQGQRSHGPRSKVKITWSSNMSLHNVFDMWLRGQRSQVSRSQVTLVRVKGHTGQSQITSVSACYWSSQSLNITPSPFLSLVTKFTYRIISIRNPPPIEAPPPIFEPEMHIGSLLDIPFEILSYILQYDFPSRVRTYKQVNP